MLLLAAVTVLSMNNGLPTRLSDIKLKVASLPVKYVRVEGVFLHLSKDEIKAALLPWVTTGFLEADMQAVQQSVAALPWVKQWPSNGSGQTPSTLRWKKKRLMCAGARTA